MDYLNPYNQLMQQNQLQAPQFLLKRIDPSDTNEDIMHKFLGEIRENGKWVKISSPIIRDKELLLKIMSTITSYVNPEVRLANLEQKEVIKKAYFVGLQLNDLLFMIGYDYAKGRIPFVDKKLELIKNDNRIKYSDEYGYIDIEGNTDKLIYEYEKDGIKKNIKVPNPNFKCRVLSIDPSSHQQIVMDVTNYIHSNLTRPMNSSEAKLIGKNINIQQIETRDLTKNNDSNIFSRFMSGKGNNKD